MSGPQPSVAVAIPTYLRGQVLLETIRQVLEQNPPADEVVVVDQTPEHFPEIQAQLRAWHESGRIKWVHQSTPNLPMARNTALRESTSDVIIYIDDDVTLVPGFVGHHRSNFADPAVVAVAGRTIQPYGWAIQHRSEPWPHSLDYLYFDLNGSERVEGIANFPGGNHAVRRDAIEAVGGYDEQYIGWAYREDTDAALRLWKAGGKIVFDPLACLTHLATPAGGCRVDGNVKRPEWHLSFPASYFAFRHLFPTRQFWSDVLVWNFRRYVLRRNALKRPWSLPWVVASYVYAAAKACRHASRDNRRPATAATTMTNIRAGGGIDDNARAAGGDLTC
jgi:GT2 family glycosyltransferase